MSGRLCKDRDGQTCDADGVQDDGGVYHVTERADAEEVEEDMRQEHHGEDTQSLTGRSVVPITDFSCGGD